MFYFIPPFVCCFIWDFETKYSPHTAAGCKSCANIDVAWMSNQRLRFARMLKHLCGMGCMDTSNSYVRHVAFFWCILLMVCCSICTVILFIYFWFFFFVELRITPMLLSLLRGHPFGFFALCLLRSLLVVFFFFLFIHLFRIALLFLSFVCSADLFVERTYFTLRKYSSKQYILNICTKTVNYYKSVDFFFFLSICVFLSVRVGSIYLDS